MTTNIKPTARQLAELLSRYGIQHVVVSPGSRNAPLILALCRCDKYVLHYVVDERVAAFVALGMAVETRKPVAVVCTSGTALLNFGPALAEAYYSNIPIVAISADRPYYDIDCNRPQTIPQAGLFDKIVRKSVDIREGERPAYVSRLLNAGLSAATQFPAGPVHINMQFEVPLTEGCDQSPVHTDFAPSCGKIDFGKLISYTPDSGYLLYIAGLSPLEDIHAAEKVMENLPANVAVIAEAQSNLSHLSVLPAAQFAKNLDKAAIPDVIVIAGSAPVYPAVYSWIERNKIKCIHVDPLGRNYGEICVASPLHIFLEDNFKVCKGMPNDYRKRFSGFQPCATSPVSQLVEALSGKEISLHIGNGMSIREAQKVSIDKYTNVWSNRGVSGIDGATSTAIGASLVADKPVVLITGDMSAAYDIGALAVKGVGCNFTMIVVNNNGGEIFRQVGTTKNLPEREQYFTAMPKFPLQKLAEAYGFDYQEVTDVAQVKLAQAPNPKIIELKISNNNA